MAGFGGLKKQFLPSNNLQWNTDYQPKEDPQNKAYSLILFPENIQKPELENLKHFTQKNIFITILNNLM